MPTKKEKTLIAQQRSSELKQRIEPYLKAKQSIPDGVSLWGKILERQEKIKKYFILYQYTF